MANYYAIWRTNYFRVKNQKIFKRWTDSLSDIHVSDSDEETPAHEKRGSIIGAFEKRNNKHYMLYGVDNNGGIPSGRFDDTGHFLDDLDFILELSEHLREDSIAIVMEVGAEKVRYVCGQAFAVDHTGHVVRICISDIYDLARDSFPNCEVTTAEY